MPAFRKIVSGVDEWWVVYGIHFVFLYPMSTSVSIVLSMLRGTVGKQRLHVVHLSRVEIPTVRYLSSLSVPLILMH